MKNCSCSWHWMSIFLKKWWSFASSKLNIAHSFSSKLDYSYELFNYRLHFVELQRHDLMWNSLKTKYICYELNTGYQEKNIFALRSSRKSINLQDLYANSAVSVIFLYFSLLWTICNYQTSWFHVYWSFTSDLTIMKDNESYPKTELKINCHCNSNNRQFDEINKIHTFFMKP